ncbi:Dioxygenase [Posidoniimonas polymericola]|uniref:Dioxygenase n=1 Tax=Posidoniimonas polymericola TaxID=2528002 RepID=A0A5C5YTP5_9BACT|nr:carboxypeptidase-like regulatory domain-containing protein [Posidoniimonas polymericola]TWT78170.1 Dioxygenase [Posidoniimonas polymericola]
MDRLFVGPSLVCLGLIAAVCSAEEAPLRVVAGRVTDEEGSPIEGALIEWGHYHTLFGGGNETTRTGPDGSYRLESRKIGHEYRLGVSALGNAPRWWDHFIPGRAEDPSQADFALQPGGVLRGTVVDEDGAPLEGIAILAMSVSEGFYSSFSMPSVSYPFPGPPHVGTTDAEGRFEIVDLPATESKVVGMTPEKKVIHREEPRKFMLCRQGKASYSTLQTVTCGEEARIVIRRRWLGSRESTPGVVRGVVLDAETNQPIPRFKLGIRHRAGLHSFEDPHGNFVLDELIEEHQYEVHVFAEGYAPGLLGDDENPDHAVGTAPSDERRFVCRLQRSQSYKGMVVDPDGRPIEGAEIVFGVYRGAPSSPYFEWATFEKYADGYMSLDHVQRMTTAADGRFTFSEGSTAGCLAVRAEGFGRVYYEAEQRPVLDDAGEAKVALARANASIRGVVRCNGQPVPNSEVSLWRHGNHGYSSRVETDEQGEFVLPHLDSSKYTLTIEVERDASSHIEYKRVLSLESGEARELDVDLKEGPLTLYGKAPRFCRVSLKQQLDEDYEITYHTIGSPDGRYLITGLNVDFYDLEVRTPGSTLHGTMGSEWEPQEIVVAKDQEWDLSRGGFK